MNRRIRVRIELRGHSRRPSVARDVTQLGDALIRFRFAAGILPSAPKSRQRGAQPRAEFAPRF
jgi:hypothetical protein